MSKLHLWFYHIVYIVTQKIRVLAYGKGLSKEQYRKLKQIYRS